jgi:hypothetical protein
MREGFFSRSLRSSGTEKTLEKTAVAVRKTVKVLVEMEVEV